HNEIKAPTGRNHLKNTMLGFMGIAPFQGLNLFVYLFEGRCPTLLMKGFQPYFRDKSLNRYNYALTVKPTKKQSA
ncbi:MAG: hypothetical protein LBU34_11090, partial [Planctomycetaceae bacterium]|nr:hypothetical protein [Planctomycetaceae bacterium]